MCDMVLKTTQLTKEYAGHPAVNNVDMTIERGEIYGFIGKNGAGKTTLLRMVTSLVRPTSGTIELFGSSDSHDLAVARMRIGTIIEAPAFFPKMNARDNLDCFRIQRGIQDPGAIERALNAVNLVDTGRKQYRQFSLGMKQRLGLALAIMGNPEFLLLDEPINGLDPTGIIEFRGILQRLHRERGVTILISSHILTELSLIATKYGIIHNGQLLKELSKEELDGVTKGYVSVRVNNAALAGAIIREKLKISEYHVYSENELRLFTMYDDPSAVVELLSANGLRVYSINEVKVSLEDYFMHLVDAA